MDKTIKVEQLIQNNVLNAKNIPCLIDENKTGTINYV